MKKEIIVWLKQAEGDELPAEKINKREAENILNLTGEILRWVKEQV